ncbi:hypothetical protein ACFSL4_19530 [Streptomyces caeni]|uniref:Uncharacterized protein n=1 Tax=Streptomyces caeni TaxID=2307231 RepID=A0ABW4ISI3_9ACTN
MRAILWGLWWLCAVFVAVCLAGAGWVVYAYVKHGDDAFGSAEKVDCAEVIHFARAQPPVGMSDEDCALDDAAHRSYDGSWRMPRAEVADWLKRSFPGLRPSTPCGADLCMNLRDEAPPGANRMWLWVEYEGGGTALVSLEVSSV